MSRTVDILINGVDRFSKTAEDASESGEQLAKELSDSFDKIALAVMGATTALEVMNREQKAMTETLDRTSYFLDSSTDQLRELAVNVSNVTRPTEDVVEGFNALMKRGVRNEEHLARLAIQYDTLADAMGENMLPVIRQVSPMFAAFGDNIAGVERYGDQLVHVFESTALELSDFNRVMRRSRIYLTNMGLTMDDTLAVMYGLGQESSNSAQAMYVLQRAARRADGDMDKFLEITDITKEELKKYKEELDNVDGTMEDFAKIHEDSYTPIERLMSIVERLQLRYADTIEILTSLMTVVAGVMGFFWIMSTTVNSLAGNIWLLHKAFVAVAGIFKTTAVLLAWKVTLVTALAGAFTYLAETMTDEVKNMERGMESLDRTIDSVAKVITGELGDSWESIEDVPQQVIDRWEKTVADELKVDVDIEEDFDSLEDFQSFLEQGRSDLETEMMNTDDTGGMISKFITDSLEKARPAIDNGIKNLEEWLFDSLEALDFEAFDGEMGEVLEETETEIGKGFTAEDITDVLKEVERQIANVDEQLEAGTIETKFEVLTGYADATKEGLTELLDNGVKPTSTEVQKLLGDFTDYATQLEDSGESTEDLEERANYLNDSFAELLKAGIDPSTKGYSQLKQAVQEANMEMGDVSDPNEQVEQRDKIIDQYQQEIDNIEKLEEEKKKLGQAYDAEAEKQKVYEQALRDLIPLYGVSESEIDSLVEKMGEYDGELDKLQGEMQGARDEISALNALDEALGDTMDLSSDKVSTAEGAIDTLTQAFVDGVIDADTFKKEMEHFNEVIDSNEPNNYAEQLDTLNKQLDTINKMEELDVIDEDDANQQRLSNVNRQLELMIENEEHINEETGEVKQEFKDLRAEMFDLEKETENTAGNTEEVAHGWGRVLDVISSNVSEVGAFKETIDNIKGFDFNEISLPDIGLDLSGSFGGLSEKISGTINNVTAKLGNFGNKIGEFLSPLGSILSVLMPILKESEYFGKIMETLGKILEPVVEIFGIILEAIYPFIRIIQIVLVPVLRLFGTIIRALIIPVFRALFPVIKLFGVVITSVAEVIARVVGIFSSRARQFADDMKKARKELLDMSWDDLQNELDSTSDGLSKVNEELNNVPQGFKLNLKRFQSMEEGLDDRLNTGGSDDSNLETNSDEHYDNLDSQSENHYSGLKTLAIGYFAYKSGLAEKAWRMITQFGSSAWSMITNFGSSAWNRIIQFGSSAWNMITRFGSSAWSRITQFGSSAWNVITKFGGNAWDTIIGFAGNAWNVIADVGFSVFDALMGAIGGGGGGGILGTVIGGIGSLFGFASGGVVKKPTMGMIGEAGDTEAVAPLDVLYDMIDKTMSDRGYDKLGTVDELKSKSDINVNTNNSTNTLTKTDLVEAMKKLTGNTGGKGSSGNVFNSGAFDVTIVSDNPEEIWRQLKRIIERENYQKNNNIVEPSNRYS